MLFHGKNCTAGADGLEWNDKKWSLVNHFIPFSEAEVGAPDRFESDFMLQYLAERGYPHPNPLPVGEGAVQRSGKGSASECRIQNGKPSPAGRGGSEAGGEGDCLGISSQAMAVMEAGKILWQAYFAHTDVRTVRDELKLNRSDVGWYQIRNALKKRNDSGDTLPVDFTPFEAAYKALSEKLQPQVFELGFLR